MHTGWKQNNFSDRVSESSLHRSCMSVMCGHFIWAKMRNWSLGTWWYKCGLMPGIDGNRNCFRVQSTTTPASFFASLIIHGSTFVSLWTPSLFSQTLNAGWWSNASAIAGHFDNNYVKFLQAQQHQVVISSRAFKLTQLRLCSLGKHEIMRR